MAETLHEALHRLGVSSLPGTISGKRTLQMFGQNIGEFDARGAWELVRILDGTGKVESEPDEGAR